MSEKRTQGRPCNGGDQVGRQHIVDSLRAMLRARRSDWASRKSLAAFSGITPALITYYFPDKAGLLEEATKPVIKEYARQLQAILRTEQPAETKLRDIISLLITCNKCDAGILEAYQELARQRSEALKPNYVAMMIDDLAEFFSDWSDQEKVQAPPAMLQGALWGVCQLVAQVNLAREMSDPESLSNDLDCVTPIYHLMAGGLDRLKLNA